MFNTTVIMVLEIVVIILHSCYRQVMEDFTDMIDSKNNIDIDVIDLFTSSTIIDGIAGDL